MDAENQAGKPNKCDSETSTGTDAAPPTTTQVYEYLMYGVSLPERALRATSAVVGGTLQESAALLVPQAFQNSKSYEVFVQQMLDFVIRDVGRVERESDDEEASEVEGYVAKKAVSGFLDLAGMATLHVSPLTVLAIVSDVAYGSQTYLQELSAELKAAGVIAEETTIDHAADLLEAVRGASATTADAFEMPPLSVDGMEQTLQQTIAKVKEVDPTLLIPQAEMQQMWDGIHEMADREGVGVLDVSSTMTLFALDKLGQAGTGALSSVKVAGNLFDRHIITHYREGLGEIRENGFYETLSTASGPYVAAVWTNFSTDKETLTEDLLNGKLIGRAWEGVRGWFGGTATSDTQTPESDTDSESPLPPGDG